MSNAQAGHGALLAIEKDGDPAGTFTIVGELNGPIKRPELTRSSEESTPHNDTISAFTYGVKKVGPLDCSVNYIFDGETHDHLTGVIKHWDDGTLFGMRITGPGSPVSPIDEWVLSGQIVSCGGDESPVREGARTASFQFQATGPFIIDGVTIGTVG